MSYLVLARKWRPRKFADLVGQGHVATTLENAIEQDRVAHAYLFSGPRGVGKTSSARILAAALNCEKGPTTEPCCKCEACEDIASGRSLDVIEIDGASNRGIDEIRDLREHVRYLGTAGKRKIYIIDEVHMLTTEAFNALLKTLEEPPAHVLFVFATTRATKVPATIRSRTIKFDFRRITTRDIAGRLEEVVKGEGFKADAKALHTIARAADGGMRDALSLLDQVRAFGGENLSTEAVEEALGIVDEELLFNVSTAARESSPAGALEVVNQLVEAGGDPGDFLLSLQEHFRNLLVAHVSKNPAETIDAAKETVKRYADEAKSFAADDLIRTLAVLGEGARDLRNSPRPRLVLEMLLLRVVRMDSTVAIGELLAKLEKGATAQKKSEPRANRSAPIARPVIAAPMDHAESTESAENGAPRSPVDTPASSEPTKPQAAAEVTGDSSPADPPPSLFAERWSAFMAHLSQENPVIASLLHGSAARGRVGGVVEILFPREHKFQKEQAFGAENRAVLEKSFTKFFQTKQRLVPIMGDQAIKNAKSRREALKKDPRIGRILNMLDGEIVG